MKKFIVSSLVFLSIGAEANVSSTLTVASNYIWRGLSFSSGGAAKAATGGAVVQGTFDYTHSSGFAAGTFVGNSDSYNFATATTERDTETDLNVSYTYKMSEASSVGLYAFWYNYLNNPSNNSNEYNAFVTWNSLRFDVAYMPNFFGTESANTYVKLSARHNLAEKFGVVAHVASSSFAEETKVGFKNYMDHRAGLFYSAQPFTVEAAYTNTDRKDLNDAEFNDKAVTLSATAAF